MFGKDKITAEEAAILRKVAKDLSDQIATTCGPWQLESIDGKQRQHNNISGFNRNKAKEMIEEGIWDLLLKV